MVNIARTKNLIKTIRCNVCTSQKGVNSLLGKEPKVCDMCNTAVPAVAAASPATPAINAKINTSAAATRRLKRGVGSRSLGNNRPPVAVSAAPPVAVSAAPPVAVAAAANAAAATRRLKRDVGSRYLGKTAKNAEAAPAAPAQAAKNAAAELQRASNNIGRSQNMSKLEAFLQNNANKGAEAAATRRLKRGVGSRYLGSNAAAELQRASNNIGKSQSKNKLEAFLQNNANKNAAAELQRASNNIGRSQNMSKLEAFLQNNANNGAEAARAAKNAANAAAAKAAPGIGPYWVEHNNNNNNNNNNKNENWNDGEGNVSNNVNGSKARAPGVGPDWTEHNNNNNSWNDGEGNVSNNVNGSKAKAAKNDANAAAAQAKAKANAGSGALPLINESLRIRVPSRPSSLKAYAAAQAAAATQAPPASAAVPAPVAAAAPKNYKFPEIKGVGTISVTKSNLNKELTSASRYKLGLEQTKVKDYIKKLIYAKNKTQRITNAELDTLTELKKLNKQLNEKLNQGVSTRKNRKNRKNRRNTRTSRR